MADETAAVMIVVRHGETLWNEEGRIQGHMDSELTPSGLAQAEHLAERLAAERATALISSDLGRAWQTASAISRWTGLEIIPDPALRERHFGVFQGLTWPEVEERHPEPSAAYWRGPDYAPPGGETARQRHDRVVECIRRLGATYAGQKIIVVTHGGPLAGLFRHIVGLDYGAPRRFSTINTAVNVLHIGAEEWRIITWGDIGHLTQIARDDLD